MGLDIAKLKAKAAQLEKGGGDYSYLKIKDGDNNIRIMPPNDAGIWYIGTAYHYEVGPDKETVLCPKKTEAEFGGNKPCPICELVSKLYKTGDPDDKEMAQDLASTKRFFLNALDLDDPAAGVQILAVGVTVFKQVLSWITHPDYGDITDPEAGYNLILTKKGKNRDTEYTTTPRKNPTPLSDIEGYDEKWLDSCHDLMSMLQFKSYEQIEGIFNGTASGKETEGDDDKEGERPTKTVAKAEAKPSKPAKVEEDTPSNGDESPVTLEELLKNPPLKCFGKEYEPKDKTCKGCDYFTSCGEATALKNDVPFKSEEEEVVEETPEVEEKPKAEPKKEAPKAAEGKKSIDDVLANLKKKK